MTNVDTWDPQQYHQFRNERTRPFYDLLAMVQAKPGMRAIDLGCGTGELTRALHEQLRCAETIGVDRSPTMLSQALAEHRGTGLDFVEGDFDAIGRTGIVGVDGLFDLVFTNAALHWVGDHASLIPRLVRMLHPGGQIAIQVPANMDHASHRIAARVAGEEPFASELGGHVRIFGTMSPEFYATMLHELGATTQDVSLRIYGHELPTSGAVVEWVKGTLLTDYQARLAPASYVAFLDRYRAELRAEIGERSPYFYAFKRTLIYGRGQWRA